MRNVQPTRASRAWFLARAFGAGPSGGLTATAAALAVLPTLGPGCFPRDDLSTYSRGIRGASAGASNESPEDELGAAGGGATSGDDGSSGGGAGAEEALGPDIRVDPGTGSDGSGGLDCEDGCQPTGGSEPPRFDASAPAPVDAGPDTAAPLSPGCAPDERTGPNGNCYVAVATLVSWEGARAACVARGTGWDLASIRSRADNDFVGSIRTAEAWLGGTDAAIEETWVWVNDGLSFWRGEGPDGTPLNGAFFNWFDDEPNGSETSDCMRLLLDASWADLECEEQRGYVCEGPPG